MIFDGEERNKVIKKINILFISLKRKLVNTAKYEIYVIKSKWSSRLLILYECDIVAIKLSLSAIIIKKQYPAAQQKQQKNI